MFFEMVGYCRVMSLITLAGQEWPTAQQYIYAYVVMAYNILAFPTFLSKHGKAKICQVPGQQGALQSPPDSRCRRRDKPEW